MSSDKKSADHRAMANDGAIVKTPPTKVRDGAPIKTPPPPKPKGK